jgi:hypothetical protein
LSAKLDWLLSPGLSFGAYAAAIRLDGADHVKGDHEIGAETMLSVIYKF